MTELEASSRISIGFTDALSNGSPLPFQKVELVQLTAPAAIGMIAQMIRLVSLYNSLFSPACLGAAIWAARRQGNPLTNIDFNKSFSLLDTLDV